MWKEQTLFLLLNRHGNQERFFKTFDGNKYDKTTGTTLYQIATTSKYH